MDTECRRQQYRKYLLFHGLPTVPGLLKGSYESPCERSATPFLFSLRSLPLVRCTRRYALNDLGV